MIGRARASLAAALQATFDEELARYEALVPDGAGLRDLAARLRAAAADIAGAPARRPRMTDAEPNALRALEALNEAIAAARALELRRRRAPRRVAAEGADRLGIAPDAYVMALVGGTGVGKSTILNALAGEELSPASARRPTTDRAGRVDRLECARRRRAAAGSARGRSAADARRDRPRERRHRRPARHRLAGRGSPRDRRGRAPADRCRRVGDRPGEVRRRGAPR